VDFIAYFDWFVGNIADIALFSAAVLVVTLSALGFTLRPAPVTPE
jgi:signal peptidase II